MEKDDKYQESGIFCIVALETGVVHGGTIVDIPRDPAVEQPVGTATQRHRESSYDIFGANAWMKSANQKLISMLPDLSEDCRIIDAGCGTGVPTQQLLDTYPRARVYCVDRSEEMLATLRQKFLADERVEVYHGDVTNLPQISGDVDAVTGFNMVHYLSAADKEAFFRSAASRVHRGGVVACNTGFYLGAKKPETKSFYDALAIHIWDGLVSRLGEVTPEAKKGLKRKDPPPEQYAISMEKAGLRVQVCQEHDQILTVQSIRNFFRTDEAASRIFPMLDRDLAKDVLGEAIDRMTANNPADATFPRKWLYLVGEKA